MIISPKTALSARQHSDLAKLPFEGVISEIRANRYTGHTAGLCAGKLQCNLVIMRSEHADDFESFCNQNPKTCPLVRVSNVGSWAFEHSDSNFAMDLRTDLPSYNVYKSGQLVDQVPDIRSQWSDDFVAFAIGCSFTFERALLAENISMRHIEQDLTVPMYRSNIPLKSVGPFGGNAVVSMRPIQSGDLSKVYEICGRYPHAHGEPVHSGDAVDIGITNVEMPDWGNKQNWIYALLTHRVQC